MVLASNKIYDLSNFIKYLLQKLYDKKRIFVKTIEHQEDFIVLLVQAAIL